MTCSICHGTKRILYKEMFDDRYGAPGKFTIYKCSRCDLCTTFPKLNQKKISHFYGKYYPLKSMTVKEVIRGASNNHKVINWLLGTNNIAHHHIKAGSNVLDIGSGSGISLIEIKKRGSFAYGIEPDINSQRIAKTLNLKVHQGFLEDHPFPKIKFDFITASQVIEHVPNPVVFLKTAASRISNNGKIIISTPNISCIQRYIFKERWIHWHIPYHQNLFSRKSINKLANRCGLKIDRISTITPNLWTLLQIRSLLTSASEGTPSKLWPNGAMNNKNKNRPHGYNLQRIAISGILFLITPINRIIDFLGLGESLLIELKKNET